MFNAATLLSTTATAFIAYNDDAKTEDRRSSKKSRRMALDRVLLRDHRREMQEALRNVDASSPDQEETSLYGSFDRFIGCHDCMELHCTCDHDSIFDSEPRGADGEIMLDEPEFYYAFDHDHFYAYGPTTTVSLFHNRLQDFSFFQANGGADLIDAVLDLNLERAYSIDPEELKHHDFFWEAHEQQDMEQSFEGSKTRRQFVELQKGRLKKVHGRSDNHYRRRQSDLNTRRIVREREDYLIEMSEVVEQASEIEQARRKSVKHLSKRAIAARMAARADSLQAEDTVVVQMPKSKKAKKSRRKSSKTSEQKSVKVFKLVRPENRTLPRLTLIGHIVGNFRSGTRFVPEELAA